MNTGEFFDLLFGDLDGWAVVCSFPGGFFSPKAGPTDQEWFAWPEERAQMIAYVLQRTDNDLYTVPTLYRTKGSRKAANAHLGRTVYADADSAPPEAFKLKPTAVVATSTGRTQCYWVVDDCRDPDLLSQYGRALAHMHRNDGCDTGGWDIGQLLRIPGTTNNKPDLVAPFRVEVVEHTSGLVYTSSVFSKVYDPNSVKSAAVQLDVEMPDESRLPTFEEARGVLVGSYELLRLVDEAVVKGEKGGAGDRSARMWALLSNLSRMGVDPGTAFVLARNAGCNKYRQDGRPEEELWAEVMRAYGDPDNQPVVSDADAAKLDRTIARENRARQPVAAAVQTTLLPAHFLSKEERPQVPYDTFVDRYQAWGSTRTDAAPQYLRAAALTCMSAVYGDFGKPPTKYDSGGLNLWFLILGGTTRSRKSTVRGMMVYTLDALSNDGFVYDIGSNATAEGLMNELAERPGWTSVFHRDEVHGLLYEVGAKNYMAGFKEALTELYDGRVHGKLRATGTVKKTASTRTVFIMLMAGVTEHVTKALTAADFASGFLARFVFIHADPPPRTRESEWMEQEEETVAAGGDTVFESLVDELLLGRSFWSVQTTRGAQLKIGFDDIAWKRLNEFIWEAGNAAEEHELREVLQPTVDRMTKSVMKTAILLAMHESELTVSLRHVLKAVSLAEEWYGHLVTVATKIRQSYWLRRQDDLMDIIEEYGGQVSWSKAYARMRRDLRPREFGEVVDALVMAGKAILRRHGNTQVIESTGR